LGIVATIPAQVGFADQPSGMGDSSLLFQYLVGGSLVNDNMLSAGLETVFPTGAMGISNGDLFLGPFVYGAQRFWKHLIFDGKFHGSLSDRTQRHGKAAKVAQDCGHAVSLQWVIGRSV
jgi:hypothetical protein